MRILLILIVAAPVLMAFRTLGLLRDWLALRAWARRGAVTRSAPHLHEPPNPDATPERAVFWAYSKFLMSLLDTAAVACFALAGGAFIIMVTRG